MTTRIDERNQSVLEWCACGLQERAACNRHKQAFQSLVFSFGLGLQYCR